MRHFHYINRKNGIQKLGGILILTGLIVVTIPFFVDVETAFSKVLLVSGVPLTLGLIIISTYGGVLLDFEAHKLKKYHSIFWIKWGEWQSLPEIENAELIHHTYRETNTPNGISPTLSREVTVYKCVLVVNREKFMVFDYSREKDAITALDIIRNGFKLS